MNAPRFSVRGLALLPVAVGALCAPLILHSAGAATPSMLAAPGPAAPGKDARLVPERSGPGHTTWDLGVDPAHPGRHRYATSIHQTPPAQLQLPEKLGAAPLVWTLADGRRVEWSLDVAPMALVELPAETADGVDGRSLHPGNADAEPGQGALARRIGAGASLRFHLPAGGLHSRIRVDAGLVAEAEFADKEQKQLTGRVIIRDEKNGERLLAISLPTDAGTLAFEESSPGYYSFNLKLAVTPASASGITPVISSFTLPAASYGGAQGSNGAGGGSVQSGSGTFLFTNVGQINPNHWAGYLEWDVSSIPASATVTGVWLNPVFVNYFTGAAQIVTVTDVDNGRVLTPMSTAAFDLNYYNDFQTMYGGHAAYGSFTVNAVGSVYQELNNQAVMDLNNRLRSPNQFAVGLSVPSTVTNDFMRFTPGSSDLYVYYNDYTPNQVVMSYVNPSTGSDNLWLYNYGENITLTGWQIQSINWTPTTQTFTLPAFTLSRHQGVKIIDSAGTNTATTLYTGGGVFTWAGASISPYNVRISLLRSTAGGGGSADFVCFGNTSPAPPAGAGWNGNCAASASSSTGSYYRLHDTDTDGLGDWINDAATALPAQALQPGMLGTRRKSDVLINHFLAYPNFNFISLVNYGPSVNLQGWTLNLFDNKGSYGTLEGTYTFPSNTLNTGEVVWLAEGTTYFATQDNLHRNLGFIMNWDVAPIGGEIVLNDEAAQGRDYVVFGDVHHQQGHLPQELSWVGPFIPVTGTQPDVIRDSDLNSLSSDGWVQQASLFNWGTIGPNARGALRQQDELGATRAVNGYYSYAATGFGAGDVFTVTQQVGLENFAIQASPVNGPLSGQLVIKKQGAASIFKSVPVTVNETGMTIVSSGLISPPLVLDPGTYAAMLYLNGNWYDAELYNNNEVLSFGTTSGATYETGTTPTTAFATNFPLYAAHAYLSTIAPPAITSANPLTRGELTLAYTFAHTSSGGYGAARTWSITAGALPPGLAMNAAGLVTGTPTAQGTYGFTVQVIDGAGLASAQAETLTVVPLVTIATTTLPDGEVGFGYNEYLYPAGGQSPNVWSGVSGFPAWLSLTTYFSYWGHLTGTPPAVGPVNITVKLVDSLGGTDSQTYAFTIQPALAITTLSLPSGFVGTPYARTINHSGAWRPSPGRSRRDCCPTAWRSIRSPAFSAARRRWPAPLTSR